MAKIAVVRNRRRRVSGLSAYSSSWSVSRCAPFAWQKCHFLPRLDRLYRAMDLGPGRVRDDRDVPVRPELERIDRRLNPLPDEVIQLLGRERVRPVLRRDDGVVRVYRRWTVYAYRRIVPAQRSSRPGGTGSRCRPPSRRSRARRTRGRRCASRGRARRRSTSGMSATRGADRRQRRTRAPTGSRP